MSISIILISETKIAFGMFLFEVGIIEIKLVIDSRVGRGQDISRTDSQLQWQPRQVSSRSRRSQHQQVSVDLPKVSKHSPGHVLVQYVRMTSLEDLEDELNG